MTRISLAAGAAAAPLFAVVSLAQALTRPGYDLTRDPVSLLSNGHLGWIQVVNFALTGLLSIAAARGTRRALAGSVWAPRLLVTIGAGLLIAAAFRLDPSGMTWHAIVHNVGGSLSFFSMIALCLVLARRFSGAWAHAGRAAAVIFAVLLLWAMTGGTGGALTLFIGVVVAWCYIAAVSGMLLRRTYGYGRGSARMSETPGATRLMA